MDEEGIPFAWLYSIPYVTNNWRRYFNMVSFLVISMAFGLFRKSPSVILASSPHLFTGLAGAILAKRHRVPFVLEIRDLWPESLIQLGLSNRLLIKALESFERYLYGRADLIVALTEGIESGICGKGFERKNIALIPNAARKPAILDGCQRENKRSLFGWTDKLVAIWIGAHGPANGLDVIIEAARRSEGRSNLHFVLIGGGSDKPRLQRLAEGLPNVEFLDAVPKSEVDGILRAADIGLLVHKDTVAVKGARPNKLFDYMAAGLPIVINLDGEARRLTEEADAGVYVPAEDSQRLADAVTTLAMDREARIAFGRNGHTHVAQAHSREDTARALASYLDDLIDPNGKSSR